MSKYGSTESPLVSLQFPLYVDLVQRCIIYLYFLQINIIFVVHLYPIWLDAIARELTIYLHKLTCPRVNKSRNLAPSNVNNSGIKRDLCLIGNLSPAIGGA